MTVRSLESNSQPIDHESDAQTTTLPVRPVPKNNAECNCRDVPWMTDVVTGLQWFIETLAGAGRGTLPFPGACVVEVKDWTVLSAAVTGSRRVVLDSRCHTDEV